MVSSPRRFDFRRFLVQGMFIAILALLVLYSVLATRSSLQDLGMTSGFGFLGRSTGWPIGFSLIPFTPNDTYARALLVGLLNTFVLGVIGLVLANIIGFSVGFARVANHRLLNLMGTIYVETFRNVPLILQVFLWYAILVRLPSPRNVTPIFDAFYLTNRGIYMPSLSIPPGAAVLVLALLLLGLFAFFRGIYLRKSGVIPSLRTPALIFLTGLSGAIGIVSLSHVAGEPWVNIPMPKGLNLRGGVRVSPEMAALAIAMGIYGGAYIGEVVRGGFNSVDPGVVEAGQAIGLGNGQTFFLLRLPLALRAIMPILANLYIWIIKATTLGIAIGFTDYFMVISISINQSGQTIELIGLLMIGFLIINFTLARAMNAAISRFEIPGYEVGE